jgi:hypothetical protein
VKRFVQEQDREFEIAGEVFTWIYPYWEDIADVFDRDTAEATKPDAEVDFTVKATIADFIERIQLFIDPDQRERWVQLTKRRKNPIPHSQYAQLYQWLLEVTSAPTPTVPSSPLEDGQQVIAAT